MGIAIFRHLGTDRRFKQKRQAKAADRCLDLESAGDKGLFCFIVDSRVRLRQPTGALCTNSTSPCCTRIFIHSFFVHIRGGWSKKGPMTATGQRSPHKAKIFKGKKGRADNTIRHHSGKASRLCCRPGSHSFFLSSSKKKKAQTATDPMTTKTETHKRAASATEPAAQDPARRFAQTLAALAKLSGGDVSAPYADNGWMGSIQRYDSKAASLARLRAARASTNAPGAPFTPTGSATPSPGTARASVDVVFARIRAAVLDNCGIAWDVVDLSEADDHEEDSYFHVIEWLGDCLSLESDECAQRRADRGVACERAQGTALEEAMWTLERLEEGALRANVRARPGLVEPQGEAMCLRLATAAAVKRIAPDADDMGMVFSHPALGRRVSRIGRVYRDAMRHRIEWAYDVYAALADKVDAMRARGEPAPDGPVPTPRSAAAWFASRPVGLLPAGLDRVLVMRPAKRRRLVAPRDNNNNITIDGDGNDGDHNIDGGVDSTDNNDGGALL